MAWVITMSEPTKPLVIGLTGGIGSGKTTVSNEFATLGITVVDADVIAREVVAPGQPLLAELVQAFGAHILLSEGPHKGTLDRAALRQIIFSDERKKQQLNSLMHPAIRQQLLAQLQAAQSAYVILSAPLLFENKLDQYCQRTLVVDVPVSVQIARTQQRDGVSKEQVDAILKAQWSREQRLAKATDVIDNSLPLTTLPNRVAELHRRYLALSQQPLP